MSILKKKQNGFSMIEVLISLLIIGVGLLGLSGLQIASVKSTSNAHSRNVASMLAMEISDRMRANREGIVGDFYDNDVDCATNEPAQCNSNTKYCTPQETARFDVQEVMCGVKYGLKREGGVENLLLAGSMNIESNTGCPDISDPNKHRITISWSSMKLDDDQRDSDENQSLQVCVIP